MSRIALLLLLTCCHVPAFAGEVDDDGWEKLYEKEAIAGFRKIEEGSKFHAWKGYGYIDRDFYRVVAVYMDSTRSDEWVADCLVSVEVEKPDVDHQITYNVTGLPRPFWDRDFLWEEEYVYDPERLTVLDTMVSTEHPDYPEQEGIVRGELMSSTFFAQWVEPEKTFVEVTIHVDPGGKLPAWLVNALSRSWPFITFRDLREQAMTAEGYEELEQAIRDAHPMDPPPAP